MQNSGVYLSCSAGARTSFGPISAPADGGPCSQVCACKTLRSGPHRHEPKFSGARVFRTTYKHLPQLLRTYFSRHFSWYSRYFPAIRDTFLAFQSLFLATPTLFPVFIHFSWCFTHFPSFPDTFSSFPDTFPINSDTFPFVFLDTFLDDLDTFPYASKNHLHTSPQIT